MSRRKSVRGHFNIAASYSEIEDCTENLVKYRMFISKKQWCWSTLIVWGANSTEFNECWSGSSPDPGQKNDFNLSFKSREKNKSSLSECGSDWIQIQIRIHCQKAQLFVLTTKRCVKKLHFEKNFPKVLMSIINWKTGKAMNFVPPH